MANEQIIYTHVFATSKELEVYLELCEAADDLTEAERVEQKCLFRIWAYLEQLALNHGLPDVSDGTYWLDEETGEFLWLNESTMKRIGLTGPINLRERIEFTLACVGDVVDEVMGRVNPAWYLPVFGVAMLAAWFGPINQVKWIGWYAIYGLLALLSSILSLRMICDLPKASTWGENNAWKLFLFAVIATVGSAGLDTYVVRCLTGIEPFSPMMPTGWFGTFAPAILWSFVGFYALLMVVNLAPWIRSKFTGGTTLLATI